MSFRKEADSMQDSLFDDFSPRERHSQILKQFEDRIARERQQRDNMFYERPFNFANHPFRRSTTNVGDSSFASRCGGAAKEIPIKVIHEKHNDATSNGEHSGRQRNEQTSSMEADTACTSNDSGNYINENADRNGQQFEAKIQPRVHHIPIKVEPRDDVAGHSRSTRSRSSSGSSHQSAASGSSVHSINGETAARMQSSPSPKDSPSTARREHIIPIRVESTARSATRNSQSPLGSSPPKVKTMTPSPSPGQSQSVKKNIPSRSSPSGVHVTRVPINQTDEDVNETHSQQQPAAAPSLKKDALDDVAAIKAEAQQFEKEVETFTGVYQDKKYLYLDEMLTRCMLKLDNIECCGRDDVRQARKAAIHYINQCIAKLEQMAGKPQVVADVVLSEESNLGEMNQEQSLKTTVDNETDAEMKKNVDTAASEQEQPIEFMDEAATNELQKAQEAESASDAREQVEEVAKSETMETENVSDKSKLDTSQIVSDNLK